MKRGKYFFIVLLFVIPIESFSMYTYLDNRGTPVYTYYLGDPLQYIFKFAVNEDTSPMTISYGLGKTVDGTGWSWYNAEYDYTDGNNRFWKSTSNEHQFTSTGEWYYSGKFTFTSGGYTEYASDDWIENRTSLSAFSFFTVESLSNPSNLSTSPQSNSDIQINWTRWEGRCVLIIRSLDNSFGTPVQGQTYSPGNTISDGDNDDVVIYVGDGTTISGELRTITDTGLTTGETYYYKIYSENYSYYSDGEIINNSGDQSLPVTLSSFTATQTKGIVTLNWTTESETNNRGFNIYSSENENGNYTQINPTLISGAGNSTTANDYSFSHKNIVTGRTYWYKLEDVSVDGKSDMHGPVSVKIEESDITNVQYALGNCYPNPFNPVTTINYSLPEKSNVNIMVYDVKGNLVKSLKSSKQDAGNYSLQWDGTDLNNNVLSAGVYFCKMTTNTGFNQTTKMILVK